MTDLISVIVLVYRVREYLDQCVQSILDQTYKNLEIILVDDGSDDECPAICDKYARMDPRVKVIHKENGGMGEARKIGILASNGKYISNIDGDDWIEPQMMERLLFLIKEFDVDIVESGVIDSWGNAGKRRVPFFEDGCYKNEVFSEVIAPRLIYSGFFFQHGISPYLVTKLFLRSKLLAYQTMSEPSKNIVDDVMCTYPCIIESRSIYITHECYYHYRVRAESAKRQIRKDVASIVMRCFPSWLGRFRGADEKDNLELQIQFFTMYLLIAKATYVFDDPESEYYLTPYGSIKKKDRIILYGAGTVGIHLKHYIEEASGNLVYWVDCNYKEFKKEWSVGSPYEIKGKQYDWIVIAIMSAEKADSAKEDLITLGIPEAKIKWIAGEYIEKPPLLLKRAQLEGRPMFF